MEKLIMLVIIVLDLWALKWLLRPTKPKKFNNVVYSTPTRISIDVLPQEVEIIENELDSYLYYLDIKKRITNRNKESSYSFLWDDQENIKQFRKKYGLVG